MPYLDFLQEYQPILLLLVIAGYGSCINTFVGNLDEDVRA